MIHKGILVKVLRNPTSRKVGPGTYIKNMSSRKLSYNIHTEKSFQMLETSKICNTEREESKTQLGSFYSSGIIDKIFKEKVPSIQIKSKNLFYKLKFSRKLANQQIKRQFLKRKLKGRANICINLSKGKENFENDSHTEIPLINIVTSKIVDDKITARKESKLNEPSSAIEKVQIKLLNTKDFTFKNCNR